MKELFENWQDTKTALMEGLDNQTKVLTEIVERQWHSPGLGEVHNHDHSKMIFCETGDGIVDDKMAENICRLLNRYGIEL